MPVVITTEAPDVTIDSIDASVEDELTVNWTDVLDNGDYRVQIQESGYKLSSDGTDDYVDFGDNYDFAGTQAFSVALRFSADAVPPDGFDRLVSKEVTDGSGRQGWNIVLSSSTGAITFERWEDGASDSVTSTTIPSAGDAVDVVATFDGSTLSLYVDTNTAEDTSTPGTPKSINDHGNPLTALAHSDQASAFHTGDLDDLRVWDGTAIGTSEVQQFMDGLATSTIPDSWWGFDEGSGTTAADSTGTVDGTISGAGVGYVAYDWDAQAPGFQETTVSEATTSHAFTGLQDGENYDVRIRSETEHATGAWDTQSELTLLPAPGSLAATSVSEDQIDLSWSDDADNEDGYEVYRERDYGSGYTNQTQIADLGPNTAAYSDTDASPGNDYRYTVRAHTEYVNADSQTTITNVSSGEVRDKDVPPVGWYVEVEHPDGNVVRPAVLGGARFLPRLRDQPTCRIPVPKDEEWLDAGWEGQPMAVYKDGRELEVDELDRVTETAEQSVLHGVGATELEGRVTTFVAEEEAHTAADTIVGNNTAYSTNVDEPVASITSDAEMQAADTTAEFDSHVTVPADVPAEVAGGELHTLQTNFVQDAAEKTDIIATNETTGNDDYNDGTRIEFFTNGEYAEWQFTNDHDIPYSDFYVRVRAGGDGDPWPIRVSVDGTDLFPGLSPGTTSPVWTQDADFNDQTSTLAAGTHTVRVTAIGSSHSFTYIDMVAPYDAGDRFATGFTYNFDNTLDANQGYLDGPETMPDVVPIEASDAIAAQQVVAGRIASSWDDTTGSQEVAVSNDGGSTWLTAANSTSVDQSFASGSGKIRARFTMSRYGSRTGQTPKTGFNGQSVQSYTLFADLDDTPLLVNKLYDGSVRDVLRQISEAAGQVWEARRLPDGTTQIEWTTPGQRTSDESAAITDYEVTKDNMRPYELVVVRGAANTRTGEQFTSNHGTAVALDHQNIREGSESVVDPSTGEQFDRDVDYNIDYEAGTVTTVSGGAISDATTYEASYRHEVRGSYPDSPPADPRTRVVTIPEATGDREAGQLALSIYDDIKEPRHEAKVTISAMEVGVSLVDDVKFPDLPGGERYRVQEVRYTPDTIVALLGNRRSLDAVINSVKERVESITRSA